MTRCTCGQALSTALLEPRASQVHSHITDSALLTVLGVLRRRRDAQIGAVSDQ